MKKWLDFLSEQSKWKYNGEQSPVVLGNSQVTSPNSMISTVPSSSGTDDPGKTQAWNPNPNPNPNPIPDFDKYSSQNLQDKVHWLDTMVQLINSKRIQQMELNTRIMNRLGRLEKAVKLPPELNRNNGNGVTW